MTVTTKTTTGMTTTNGDPGTLQLEPRLPRHDCYHGRRLATVNKFHWHFQGYHSSNLGQVAETTLLMQYVDLISQFWLSFYNQFTGTRWPLVLPSWDSSFITSNGWWSRRLWDCTGEMSFAWILYSIPLIFTSRSSLMTALLMSWHSWQVFSTLRMWV